MTTAADPVRFRQGLLRLLESDPPHDEHLLADIEARTGPGQPLYSSLLHVFTHLSFTEAQARRHWERVLAHRESLRAVLGRDVGLRVALLDYFVNVSRELKNPKVIEISIYQRTERSALTDGLTGLYNHAYFEAALRRELLRARRQGLKLSLLMLDLDNFKQLNDSRGHVEGDRTLVRTASIVNESLREIDISARYGGEEFAVILPDTSQEGALVVAERIRARIEDEFRRRRSARVTVSGGIATYPDDALDPEDLVVQADRLLYRSKADGKNRITVPEPNRRRYERRPLTHAVELTVGSRNVEGLTRNVSEGGLLIAAAEPLPVGSRIGLTLRPNADHVVSLQGQVVRSEALLASCHDLGVQLLSDPRRNRALLMLQSQRVGHA